jgi:nitrate reductase assembly molybdenum cofactor insertion protein NarJ
MMPTRLKYGHPMTDLIARYDAYQLRLQSENLSKYLILDTGT